MQKIQNNVRIASRSVDYLLGLLVAHILSACGGGGSPSTAKKASPLDNYVARSETYFANFEIAPIEKPNWVAALQMDQMDVVTDLMAEHDRVFSYHFMTEAPTYELTDDIRRVQPATPEMRIAASEIFGALNSLLDVNFQETDDPHQNNVISIGMSLQLDSAGFGFFPNSYYFVGSDVFIADDYGSPLMRANGFTNYDYEVLLHEIGHALGLKHTFAADEENEATLKYAEDTTKWTAMSYTEVPRTFDGEFRPFDIMALSEFYGINRSYHPGDDTYTFNSAKGVIVADGGGLDVIDYSSASKNSYLDLRAGAESYLGEKANLIIEPNQLAIAYSVTIENIMAGEGDDTIIGNEAANVIHAHGGDDRIYAGEGADSISAGSGSNLIDLAEATAASDTVIFDTESLQLGHSTIYGFQQHGSSSDILEFTHFAFTLAHDQIENITTSSAALGTKLATNKVGLTLQSNSDFILFSSESNDLGSPQELFQVKDSGGSFEINHFATLYGANLDLDFWDLYLHIA
jgi:serralysin